jgi:hypothetical protein
MDRLIKMRERVTGKVLSERYKVAAKHALYREDGKWFHKLKRFPGALFDANGYVIFNTEEEFDKCSYLQIAHDVHAPRGISSIPSYVIFNVTIKEAPTREGQLLETSPPASRLHKKRSSRRSKTSKIVDYSENDAKNRALGLAGERLVLEYEKQLLIKAGRADLAAKVRHVALSEGDGTGYDIESFTPSEEVKYIEVKTTSGAAGTAFYITSNEIDFSKEQHKHYYLYRVYEYEQASNSGKFYIIPGSIDASFNLAPTQYRAYL